MLALKLISVIHFIKFFSSLICMLNISHSLGVHVSEFKLKEQRPQLD